jgi:branched-chain amino acid transport system substrate-binding protein
MATQERRGIRVAVDQLNANGGIDGRQVDLITDNTESNPETALQKAKRLVEQEGADMLFGAIVSSSALAVTEYANSQEVPYYTNASADPLTGENCKRSTFVLNPSELMRANMMAPTMIERSGTTGWIHIYDFAWGYSIQSAFDQVFPQMDADVTVENVTRSPLTATDFSNSISQIASADLDWVLLGIGGAGLSTFLKQAAQFDLQSQVDIYGPEAVQSARRDAGDAIRGMYTHGRYTHTFDTEPNAAFVEAFTAENDLPPNQTAKDAWEAVNLYKAAVEETGSTAFEDVVSATEDLEIDSLMGSLGMRGCDHRCIRPMHVAQVGEDDEFGIPAFDIVETVPGEDTMPACEDTGCQL